MIEMTTHPRDPWRYHRAEQAGCEALLAQALDAALQGREIEAGTRAAILADAGLAAGRMLDATIATHELALEGQVQRAKRENRLLANVANARGRLVRSMDIYREELGAETWERVMVAFSLELLKVHQATRVSILKKLGSAGRRERRVLAMLGEIPQET